MPASLSNIFVTKIATLFFLILAASLQIQVTLFSRDGYEGLRLNLTDLFLPFIGLFIAGSIILKQSKFPAFQIKHIYTWLIGLSALFCFGLANTYISYGDLNQWALINKFCGWFILCSYFLMGAWLIQNTPPQILEKYLKITLLLFLAVSMVEITTTVIFYYGANMDVAKYQIPIEGLMANKNTLIFWTLCLLSIATLVPIKHGKLIQNIFWFLLPFIFILTGARAGYISFAVILPFLIYFVGLKTIKKPILLFTAGFILMMVFVNTATRPISSVHTSQLDFTNQIENIASEQKIEENMYKGDSLRLRLIYFAKDMITERPLTGNGLGASVFEQKKQWGAFENVIDNTPLWITAEFGLTGLCLFLTFYSTILIHFWKNSRNNTDPFYQKLYQSLFLMMLIFAIMSLFHEILYTRFLWFFMGLGLAYPVLSKPDKSTSSDT